MNRAAIKSKQAAASWHKKKGCCRLINFIVNNTEQLYKYYHTAKYVQNEQ